MPFTQLAIKNAIKGIRKRAAGFVLLAILFLAVGVLQDAFVKHQIYKTTTLEMDKWANEIKEEIYSSQWELNRYRRASIPATGWYVFSTDGLLIDNVAPIPGLLKLFHAVRFPTNLTDEIPE